MIEVIDVDECLVGKVMGLEVAPDRLDVVQFGSVFRQPLDAQPMGAGSERCAGEFAGVNGSIVLDQHDRRDGSSRLGTEEPVQLFEMSDEIAAALGPGSMDDELTGLVVEGAEHRDFLGLPRRGNAQIGARLRPGAGQIRMRQRLAFIAEQQDDVVGLGLLFEQLQTKTDPFDLLRDLASFQRVPGTPPAELFFRSALDNCERLMLTPSRASISARNRGIVQLGRSATGSMSKGVATRSAAALFTGAGPEATVAFSASTPARMKSLRHRRTVSSRTPNASEMRPLVQPASVSKIARARSASPRSRELASKSSSERCAPVAKRGDFPVMSSQMFDTPVESARHPLVNPAISA